MQASYSSSSLAPQYWPSARQFTEAIQWPAICFADPQLKNTLPAVDRLGMPLVTSGQFAFVYKVKSVKSEDDFAVRCFRGYLGDRDQRYRAIQRHLKDKPIPQLSDFTYSPEGILVGGRRYPILHMKWIDGPTLDFYLEEMIERKEVLFHLSQEWLKLLTALREAGIAHGDLQHGNIIVKRGALCLVDHDGLFVPEMAGWRSSEVGHQHYQHPLRDAQHFDANLDRFSALVIYLTLISLMERPSLWHEHHDENLLFTKSDFQNPAASPLFAKIKEIGPEHERLAGVLEIAATGQPADVPSLLDLVAIKSNLPVWMTSVELDSHVKTRELKVDPRLRQEHPRWIPKQTTHKPSVPSTPASPTIQTIFQGQVIPAPPYGPLGISDPTDVWRNTPKFAKEMLGKTFIWWYWGIYVLLKLVGLDLIPAFLFAIFSVLAFCFAWGFIRSQQTAHQAQLTKSTSPQALPNVSPIVLNPQVSHRTPASITTSDPIIGNTALNIYHQPKCEWVTWIGNKQRINFASAVEALSVGYKPCRVCFPLQPSTSSLT